MGRFFTSDKDEQMAERDEVAYCQYYHKYRLKNGEVNPKFYENDSGCILDLKEKKCDTIADYLDYLDELFKKDISICVVPSHEASSTNDSGIARLARGLAQRGRKDKVDFLLRKTTVEKRAAGGDRSYQSQRESIKINPDISVLEDTVIVMDDVTTTGNSLQACRDILLDAGASHVAMYAIGKTVLEEE